MDTAFYRDLEVSVLGTGADAELTARVSSTPACGGPWSPRLQHGGPPSALLVAAAERLAAAATGRDDLLAVRIAAEFLSPVPVAALRVTARISRLSRSAVLVTADLRPAGGGAGTATACLQARVWLLAEGEQPAGREVVGQRPDERDIPPPDGLPAFDLAAFPYADHLDWRLVHGSAYQPGPAAVWVTPRVPLIEQAEDGAAVLSALQRVALIGDSASGVSSELDWQAWSFANVDLDLHLMRPVRGEWLLMEAQTDLGAGVALARSTLSDADGPLAAGTQTLLLRRA